MSRPDSLVMFYDGLIKDFDEKAEKLFGERGYPRSFRHIRQTWVNQKRRYEIEVKLLENGKKIDEDAEPTPAQLQAFARSKKADPSNDVVIIL